MTQVKELNSASPFPTLSRVPVHKSGGVIRPTVPHTSTTLFSEQIQGWFKVGAQ